MGPCGNGTAWKGRGRGFARFGGGFGMRRSDAPLPDQKDLLQQQQNWLQTQLNAVNQRLHDIEPK